MRLPRWFSRPRLDVKPGDTFEFAPDETHPCGERFVVERAGTICDFAAHVGGGFAGPVFIPQTMHGMAEMGPLGLGMTIGARYLAEQIASGQVRLVARNADVAVAAGAARQWATEVSPEAIRRNDHRLAAERARRAVKRTVAA
jgi:hypothetical protein